MADAPRHHYVIDLEEAAVADPWLDFEVDLVTASPEDTERLAELMIEAYRGTIDDDGESLGEARQEVETFMKGSPLLDSSHVAIVDEDVAGAILVGRWREEPLVAYVMTRPEFKNQGLGTVLVRASIRSLREAGAKRVHAFITDGNVASEALFRGAGAVLAGDETRDS